MIFDLETARASQIALAEPSKDRETPYAELRDSVGAVARLLSGRFGFSFLAHFAANTIDSLIAYLAALEARIPLVLLEPSRMDHAARLLELYRPAGLLLPPESPLPQGYRDAGLLPGLTYRVAEDASAPALKLQPDLAVLLTTSGSTGSPKLVRLTRGNIEANAKSIAGYLDLHPGERPLLSLPVHYSYGLSIVNSHLRAGATIVLTQHSFLMPEFWQVAAASACTSFAGVPYMYETLDRLRFDPGRYPSMHTYTQAGGALRPDLISRFHQRISSTGARFFVMYGQTEATARMSYVPHERLGEKIGSIGIAIPEGHFSLAAVKDWPEASELVYSGPNVMMGYAEGPSDLALGDELQGVLRTGDLARSDDDGFLFLTGRLKRFAKLFGRRISLADIEHEIERDFECEAAVTERDGSLELFLQAAVSLECSVIAHRLAAGLGIPPRAVKISQVERLPRTASGKKDYKALP